MAIMSLLVSLQSGEDLQEPIAIIAFALLGHIGYSFG